MGFSFSVKNQEPRVKKLGTSDKEIKNAGGSIWFFYLMLMTRQYIVNKIQ